MELRAGLFDIGKLLVCFLLMSVCGLCLCAQPAQAAQNQIDSDEGRVEGSGTASDPYLYLIDDDARVTWKHLAELAENGTVERFECRGDTGDLRYAWTFDGAGIIDPNGPYRLGIDRYDSGVEGLPAGASGLYFSFAEKRDLPGRATIDIDVSDRFADGTQLELFYYGGYDPTVIHGEGNPVDPQEYLDVGQIVLVSPSVAVDDGIAEFDISYGGNYMLVTVDDGAALQIVSTSDSPLGSSSGLSDIEPASIEALFGTSALAEAIASRLDRGIYDTVTQADLDSITSLYVDGVTIDRSALDALSSVPLRGLTQLTLTNCGLTYFPRVSMPALVTLDLSHNELDAIPSLSDCTRLENLVLADNDIGELSAVDAIDSLQTLDLSGNRLAELADMSMPVLVYLDASDNEIASVEDFIGMPCLETLDLSDNHLEKTPVFTHCDSLSTIEMDGQTIPVVRRILLTVMGPAGIWLLVGALFIAIVIVYLRMLGRSKRMLARMDGRGDAR